MTNSLPTEEQKNQKGLAITAPIVAMIVLAIIALIGVYELGKHNSSKKINTAPKPQNATAQKVVNSAPVSAQQNTLTIKEYGVAVPLSDDVKGVTYIAQSNPQHTLTVVDLKSDEYSSMANRCVGQPAGTDQNLAVLVKTTGQYNAAQNPDAVVLKQFKDFYIANIGGSQPAKLTCKDTSVQADYDALYSKLNSGLQASFANATLAS